MEKKLTMEYKKGNTKHYQLSYGQFQQVKNLVRARISASHVLVPYEQCSIVEAY